MSIVTKLAIWSTLLLALVVYTGVRAIWNNQYTPTHDYTYWQNQYKDIAYKLATTDAVRQATQDSPVQVKQVTVLGFPILKQDGTTQQRVDRCASCHVGLENPQMTAENIIKIVDNQTVPTDQVTSYLEAHPKTREIVQTVGAHPGIAIEDGDKVTDMGVAHSPHLTYGVVTNSSPTPADQTDYQIQRINLKQHPFATWGCTTCHYGAGRELVQTTAHGYTDFSMQPMLPRKYMEAACAQCHASYSPTTFAVTYLPQMTMIARGEQLFKQYACYGCHKIDGFSKGNIGPELTYEGLTKPIEGIQHQLWDPRYQVGSCVMPYFFSERQVNTDLPPGGVVGSPQASTEIVDPRSKTVQAADVESDDIRDSLQQHGYIPDATKQDDVDALVTFIVAQTGQSYADSKASRFTAIAAYNTAKPGVVPVTVAEGKTLFETSGCYSCHYIGDPDKAHITGDPKFGKGGIAGPELSWEGTRHSQQWLIAHYENPQAFVPGSIMPIFPFSDSQRAALSLYDSSQHPHNANARPVSADQDLPGGKYDEQSSQPVVDPQIRYMSR